MKLSERQRIFTKNIAELICHAYGLGIEMTFGEAFRTNDQVLLNFYGYEVRKMQTGNTLYLKKREATSKTLNSRHQDRLAVDFNFFIDGRLTYDFDRIKPLGDFWVSLHPDNRWGGDFNKNGTRDGFVDVPHFEMTK